MAALVKSVKVFSTTKRHDRQTIGERVTTWLRDNPNVHVREAVVVQSSDRQFHCFSIVLLCSDP